ncbi:MAG: potassium-transporting ATPase subunit KdpC [Candidatus Competibacteraceae bacterium]|uniref:Potassium-transporting ATPase KdpC subunit n=1 Tax=Candidatus Contendobacter odensis Run_B_J11 TaxID=1400861 RepID=A0A7U7GD73_9GAMM|nr:potassium-transporting ATPase subunit KdpC [Candidatus Contendobacter odensis]MBK8538137.1 potassium-transporting ATPase subunit KdpC [Candidatus Competibacteraceae bacterium]CDH46127.1 P-type ATPase, high-affinity potassium transport system, C chain [Candidatus Contendobacter odensis Run_B_J11]
MKTLIRPALSLFILLTIITGLIYPLAVTGIGQALFPAQAAGSLIQRDGKVIGSRLIGQNFTDPKYFWGRPSATGPYPYNAAASSGSNLGPLNPALHDAVAGRVKALREADPGNSAPVPVDLVTTSASGLDPQISPAAAAYQAARVARVRGLKLDAVQTLVAQHTEDRQWGVFGEPRVKVLELNLALDGLQPKP